MLITYNVLLTDMHTESPGKVTHTMTQPLAAGPVVLFYCAHRTHTVSWFVHTPAQRQKPPRPQSLARKCTSTTQLNAYQSITTTNSHWTYPSQIAQFRLKYCRSQQRAEHWSCPFRATLTTASVSQRSTQEITAARRLQVASANSTRDCFKQ